MYFGVEWEDEKPYNELQLGVCELSVFTWNFMNLHTIP